MLENNTLYNSKHCISYNMHIPDRLLPPRALAVLPAALNIRRGVVYPRRSLPSKVRFGPVEGICQKLYHAEAMELVMEAAKQNEPIFLLKQDMYSVTHINVTDKDKSNWLSLIPLGDQQKANIWLYEDKGALYGITTKILTPFTPLRLGYSKSYFENHKLVKGSPVFDLCEVSSAKKHKWSCHECNCTVSSELRLLRHINFYHKAERSKVYRRQFNCKFCLKSYTRKATLVRHMSRYCSKHVLQKNDETENSKIVLHEINNDINLAPNIDDTKLPSDESLQNYTSNLDISTNLFDPDKIPILDLSGSCKSDFNPFAVNFKDESVDLGFLNVCNKPDERLDCKNDNQNSSNEKTMLIECPHCQDTIVRGKLRQHTKNCRACRFQCVCGCVFFSRWKLSKHTELKHPTGFEAQNEIKHKAFSQYKCEQCNMMFKRRGMLVNHLWRIHQMFAENVPLEKRERLYPCTSCPKIYRTAAKRDQHAKNYHPGLNVKMEYIEGNKKSVTAAACSECPRQYATRAKLLQHMRQAHPTKAPPLMKKPAKT